MAFGQNPFEDEFGSMPGPGVQTGGDVLLVSPPREWTDENLNYLVYYLKRALENRFDFKIVSIADLNDTQTIDKAILKSVFVLIIFDRPTEDIVYSFKTAELHEKPAFVIKAYTPDILDEKPETEVPVDMLQNVINHFRLGDEEKTFVKLLNEMIIERDSVLMGMFIQNGEFRLDFLNELLKHLDVYTRRTLLKEMQDKYPHDRSFWLASGRSKMLDGDIDEAMHDFDEATRISPDDPWVFAHTGTSLVDIGDFDKALEAISSSIKIKPVNPHAHFVRGNAQYLLDNWEEAINSFETAYNQKKDYTSALNNLAHLLILHDRHDDALKLLNRTIMLDKNYPFSYLNRATCLREMGKPRAKVVEELQKAEKVAHRNIKKGDDFERSAYCLFYVYASVGNVERAAEYLQRCVDYRLPVKKWRTLERVDDENIARNPRLLEIAERSQF